jgi:hypothetical protein
MERITKFKPAYDERHNPKGNYGIHGADLLMILKGEHGAVQFVVYTNWYLPNVRDELINKPIRDSLDIKCRFLPMPADLGYHSKKPIYEDQELLTNDCELTGGDCYYDGTACGAESVYDVLVEKGSDAVWDILEERYIDVFGELK